MKGKNGKESRYIRIDDFVWSVRTRNILKREGLIYLGQISAYLEHKFLFLPNLGRKSLKEVKSVLA